MNGTAVHDKDRLVKRQEFIQLHHEDAENCRQYVLCDPLRWANDHAHLPWQATSEILGFVDGEQIFWYNHELGKAALCQGQITNECDEGDAPFLF